MTHELYASPWPLVVTRCQPRGLGVESTRATRNETRLKVLGFKEGK